MPGERYFALSPQEPGVCNFRIALARPWEFSWDDLTNSKYIQKIEIKVTVIDE